MPFTIFLSPHPLPYKAQASLHGVLCKAQYAPFVSLVSCSCIAKIQPLAPYKAQSFKHLLKAAPLKGQLLPVSFACSASLAFLSRACPAQEFAKCLSWAYSFIFPICLYLRPCSSICHCPASLFMVLFPFRVSLPSIPLHALPLLPGCCILQ